MHTKGNIYKGIHWIFVNIDINMYQKEKQFSWYGIIHIFLHMYDNLLYKKEYYKIGKNTAFVQANKEDEDSDVKETILDNISSSNNYRNYSF